MSNVLENILESLDDCMRYLNDAANAFQEGNMEEMFGSMTAMAPRLERATNKLRVHLENREASYVLDTEAMDLALSNLDMTWGNTQTPEKSEFIADNLCIMRKSVCDPQYIEDLEQSRNKVNATHQGISSLWGEIVENADFPAEWGYLQGEHAFFVVGGQFVGVDAGRLAGLRAFTGFNRVNIAMLDGKDYLVMLEQGNNVPLAAIIIEKYASK